MRVHPLFCTQLLEADMQPTQKHLHLHRVLGRLARQLQDLYHCALECLSYAFRLNYLLFGNSCLEQGQQHRGIMAARLLDRQRLHQRPSFELSYQDHVCSWHQAGDMGQHHRSYLHRLAISQMGELQLSQALLWLFFSFELSCRYLFIQFH